MLQTESSAAGGFAGVGGEGESKEGWRQLSKSHMVSSNLSSPSAGVRIIAEHDYHSVGLIVDEHSNRDRFLGVEPHSAKRTNRKIMGTYKRLRDYFEAVSKTIHT